MKKIIIAVFMVLSSLLLYRYILLSPAGEVKTTPTVMEIPPLNEDKLLEIIQNWRTSNNLSKYVVSDHLCQFASVRLSEIQTDFSHKGFEQLAREMFGNTTYKLAENLNSIGETEQLTLNGWLNSPGHLKNLKFNYKYTCVKTKDHYAVQIFGNF